MFKSCVLLYSTANCFPYLPYSVLFGSLLTFREHKTVTPGDKIAGVQTHFIIGKRQLNDLTLSEDTQMALSMAYF